MSTRELASYASDLHHAAVKIQGIIKQMESQSLESVRVDGVTKLSRGTRLVLEFVPNLERGMVNLR